MRWSSIYSVHDSSEAVALIALGPALDEHYSAVKANTLDAKVPTSEARFAGEG